MNQSTNDLQGAFDDVSASSAGGAPFLISYGLTFLITAVLSLFLSRQITALIAMFQGAAALPLAFWLERKMGSRRMADDNPLRPLSVQLAMSQALGLPVLILVYSLNPNGIPLALASLGGVHFMPYAWLHRTRVYVWFAVAVSMGGFAIQLVMKSSSFSIILFYMAVVYWVTAPFVRRHAAKIIQHDR